MKKKPIKSFIDFVEEEGVDWRAINGPGHCEQLYKKVYRKYRSKFEPPEEPKKKKRKRRTVIEGRDSRAELNSLLKDLGKAKDPDEKKQIRRRLRRLGHKGGLR